MARHRRVFSDITLAGGRAGYRPQRQSVEFRGRHGGVGRDGLGGQGRKDLDQPLARHRGATPGPQVLMTISLPPWLLVHERQQDTTQVSIGLEISGS